MSTEFDNSKKRIYWWCAFVSILVTLTFLIAGASDAISGEASKVANPAQLGIPTSVRMSLVNDAIPVPGGIRQRESARAALMAGPGYAPGWDRTSDFMIGKVAVGIILPESDGSLEPSTEDWTAGEKTAVRQEIVEGLDWWEAQAQAAGVNLEFIVPDGHPLVVNTGYEPIDHPGLGPEVCGEENLWIDEVMGKLGYDDTDKTYIEDVRDYDNDLRESHDADWAFTIFVADSSYDNGNDPEGPDGYGFFKLGTWCGPHRVFGWAYRPGPFLVMNSQNAPGGGYGPDLLDEVTRHEVGHIFGAADEICSDDCNPNLGRDCDTRFGYLSAENHNCNWHGRDWCGPPTPTPSPTPGATCNLDDGTCVMRAAMSGLCYYTKGQVGWWDDNGNGLPDPIDTTPDVTLNPYLPDPTTDRTPTYTGSAQDIPFHTTHPDYVDVTINDISVEYRVDGGPWHPATPADGAFDSPYEEFTFTPLFCQNGAYLVEARAINAVGHTSSTAGDTLTVSSTDACWYAYLPLVMRNYGAGSQAATELIPAPSDSRLPVPTRLPPDSPLPVPTRSPFDSPLPTPTPVPQVFDDDEATYYGGRWRVRKHGSAYGGSYRLSPCSRTSYAEFDFRGSAISFRYRTGPKMGRLRVWLDGEHVAEVDSYASRSGFATWGPWSVGEGEHTLRLEAVALKCPVGVGIDSFTVGF